MEAFSPRCGVAVSLALALTLLTLAAGRSSAAGVEDEVSWLSGSPLQKQLSQPVSVSWAEAPLRPAMLRWSRAQRLAIIIDRRVDPGRLLTLSVENLPLEQACERIARECGLGFCLVGPVAYFGPAEMAAKLRTLVALRKDEAQATPIEARRRLLKSEPWQWDDFAKPRALVEALAQSSGLKLAGSERIPHDLWSGASLPPVSLLDRLALVAAQYDLTFRIDDEGQTLTLVPIPPTVEIQRSYPGGKKPEELMQRWKALVPSAKIELQQGKLLVWARLEDHERLSQPKPAGGARPASGGATVYTLKLSEVRLDKLLEELERRLQVEIRLDRPALQKAKISPEQRVSLEVDKATLDELLRAALEPAGLAFRHVDKRIEVFPAQSP
jgi:hypothetical protein